MLAAFFSLMGCATQAFACVFEFAPLIVLSHEPYVGTFKRDKLHSGLLSAQAVCWDIRHQSGLFRLLQSRNRYLVFKSTLLTRILGVLMAISCSGRRSPQHSSAIS